jgi:hypothetical protein
MFRRGTAVPSTHILPEGIAVSVSYQARPIWDFNREWVSCDALIGTRLFRCNVTSDFLTGGLFRPLQEEEGMRLFQLRKPVIESHWETAARAAAPADDELTVSSSAARSGRRDR